MLETLTITVLVVGLGGGYLLYRMRCYLERDNG